MTVSAIAGAAASPSSAATRQTLGQKDFIKLMTTQMQMQDPLEPVDNKEMIAQMAQFSSLAGIDAINQTLQSISAQLDRVLALQTRPNPTQTPAQET